tara:strand:- start:1103 stop:1420 length:318 start_codon:yes stop_codon:yes gene_type:complete
MKILSRQPPVKTFKDPVDLVDTHASTIYMLQFANQNYYEELAIACFTITAQLKYKQNREEVINLEVHKGIKELKEIWKEALEKSDSLWYDNFDYSVETPTLSPVK